MFNLVFVGIFLLCIGYTAGASSLLGYVDYVLTKREFASNCYTEVFCVVVDLCNGGRLVGPTEEYARSGVNFYAPAVEPAKRQVKLMLASCMAARLGFSPLMEKNRHRCPLEVVGMSLMWRAGGQTGSLWYSCEYVSSRGVFDVER